MKNLLFFSIVGLFLMGATATAETSNLITAANIGAEDDVIATVLSAARGESNGVGENGFGCMLWIEKKNNGKLEVMYGDPFGQFEAFYPSPSNKGTWVLDEAKQIFTLHSANERYLRFNYDNTSLKILSYTRGIGDTVDIECKF